MSGNFGLGDGMNDLTGTRALAESQVADARRGGPLRIGAGRWPTMGRVVLALGSLGAAIVLLGWILTALNG